MELKNKKVLVVGTGISGIGAALLLQRVGAVPVLFDENEKVTLEQVKEKLPENMQVQLITGLLSQERRKEFSLAVLSPGVPVDSAFVEQLRSDGIPVWGEIELAYTFSRGTVIGITGTNGKTTTTALTGQIMKDYFGGTFVVGNIGAPYTMAAADTKEDSVTVAELSSFQLETVNRFRPHVSAILNITPDHLNRHHTMENYAAAKERIAKNQTKDDVCVLNYEDPYTRAFGEKCPARVFWFSSKRRLEEGIFLEGEDICLAGGSGFLPGKPGEKQTCPGKKGCSFAGEAVRLMNIHEMKLVGMCNVENVMAAIAIALSMKVPPERICRTVREFDAVEHRIEFVATKGGVDYYNDSKGTNPDAAIQGIRAMSKPTILIGGGYDKQSAYDEWIEAFEGKVKWLVLIGQTADKIEACARRHGMENIIRAERFEEALKICTDRAVPGDAVLLSPACASWGMFPNYEVRGKRFKDYVNGLKE